MIVECDLDLGAHVTLLTALLSTVPLPKLRRWTMWALRVADEGVVEAWLRAARIESEGAVCSVAWRGVVWCCMQPLMGSLARLSFARVHATPHYRQATILSQHLMLGICTACLEHLSIMASYAPLDPRVVQVHETDMANLRAEAANETHGGAGGARLSARSESIGPAAAARPPVAPRPPRSVSVGTGRCPA